jgi:hypothetical protein
MSEVQKNQCVSIDKLPTSPVGSLSVVERENKTTDKLYTCLSVVFSLEPQGFMATTDNILPLYARARE